MHFFFVFVFVVFSSCAGLTARWTPSLGTPSCAQFMDAKTQELKNVMLPLQEYLASHISPVSQPGCAGILPCTIPLCLLCFDS
jgi:hypothetical protein